MPVPGREAGRQAGRFGRAFGVLFCRELAAMRVLLLFTAATMLLMSLALAWISRVSDEDKNPVPPGLQVEASLVDDDNSQLGHALGLYFKDIKFVRAVHRDSLPQAKERLRDGQTFFILYLPPGFLSDSGAGMPKQAVELWFNPDMMTESRLVGTLLRQHAAALDFLYSAVFGYQKVFVDLGGDEDASWDRMSRHALNVVTAYLDRNRFTADSDLFQVNALVHALSGVLLILAILPSIGVLAATARSRQTAQEDRLLIACGHGPLVLARLAGGMVWWALLILPLLAVLSYAGLALSTVGPAVLLASVYLMAALVMLALGRVRAPVITVLQTGWLLILFLLILGGVLYPVSLFPVWLTRLAQFTPLYAPTQVLYLSFYNRVPMTGAQLLPLLWPLLPASLMAILFGRRRV